MILPIKAGRGGQVWTDEEDAKLAELNQAGVGLKKIALAMMRTEESVKAHLRELRIWREDGASQGTIRSNTGGQISKPAPHITVHKARGRY